jgi:FixJ family two-component response regulator
MNHLYAGPTLSPQPACDTPTVFVVDSDAGVRESLELLIRATGWQPCTSASAEEFLARPRVTKPGCLLIEQHLPGLSGLDLQRIVAARTELPVIFMSSHPDIPATVQAMKTGALEFLIKPIVGDVLMHAIRHAVEHSRTVLQELAQLRALQERYEALSPRERDVLKLVASGWMNKRVGEELGISEITVKAHRGRMMRKMRANSLAQLVTMCAGLRPGTVAPLLYAGKFA